MKIFTFLAMIVIFLILPPLVGEVSAQTFKSNQFETKVGDATPKPQRDICPLDTTISCGTYWNPRGNCGHCLAPGYTAGSPPASFNGSQPPKPYYPFGGGTCLYAGTLFGIDIAGEDGQEIKLPTIREETVEWEFYTEYASAIYRNEAIQAFTGRLGNQRFYLQLHHTKPGSANRSAGRSGDKGANICADGCGERHTHVQLATGAAAASESDWLDVLDPKGGQLLCQGK